jgi:hypothetical protein
MARRERINRYPTVRFVDVGFEPVAYAGDERQVAAPVSLSIPFGRDAGASERRYQALSIGQRSVERAAVDEGVRTAVSPVEEINRFRRRGPDWLGLLEHADTAELVADRWWKNRLADSGSIAQLLEEVYDARIVVLAAQERAGRASCGVLASTGASVEDWPR